MSASVNKATILGNLGADPEVRYTQGGDAVCNLRIATSETWNDNNGQRQERTQWHRVVVWGKLAELCGQYLSSGSKAYVEGQMEYGKYTNNDGIEIPTAEIVVRNFGGKVVFLDGGGSGGGRGNGGSRKQNRGGNQGGSWGSNNGGGQDAGGQQGDQSGGWGNQGGGKPAGGGWGGNRKSGGGGGWGKKNQPASDQGNGGSGGRSDSEDPIPF